jgi:hypothetical protein
MNKAVISWIFLPFALFLLAIVLSVLLQYKFLIPPLVSSNSSWMLFKADGLVEKQTVEGFIMQIFSHIDVQLLLNDNNV